MGAIHVELNNVYDFYGEFLQENRFDSIKTSQSLAFLGFYSQSLYLSKGMMSCELMAHPRPVIVGFVAAASVGGVARVAVFLLGLVNLVAKLTSQANAVGMASIPKVGPIVASREIRVK